MVTIPQFGLGMTAIAAALIFTGAAPATGDSPPDAATAEGVACAPRDELVSQLGKEFRENQRAVGMLGDKAIMEVFVSSAGTWTILATDTSGTSCIIAAGRSWDEAAPRLAGQEV